MPDPLEEASRGSQAVLAERVIQLQAAGVLRAENPEIIGLALWSQIHGITTIVLDTPVFKSVPAEQAEGLARACVEAIIVGLRA